MQFEVTQVDAATDDCRQKPTPTESSDETPTESPEATASQAIEATEELPPSRTLGAGAVAGIAVGSALLLVVIVLLVRCLICRRRKVTDEEEESSKARGAETGSLSQFESASQENQVVPGGDGDLEHMFLSDEEPEQVVPKDDGSEAEDLRAKAGGRCESAEARASKGRGLGKKGTGSAVDVLASESEVAAAVPEPILNPHGVDGAAGAKVTDPHGVDPRGREGVKPVASGPAKGVKPVVSPLPKVVKPVASPPTKVVKPLVSGAAESVKPVASGPATGMEPELSPPAEGVKPELSPPAEGVKPEASPAKVVKPARVRPKLAIDGTSAVAFDVHPFGATSIRNQRGESLGVEPSGSVTWGNSDQKFETFGVAGRTAMRAENGKFVRSLADGTMRADATEIGAEELFIPQINQGKVQLMTKDGGCLGGDVSLTMDEEVVNQIEEAAAAPTTPQPHARIPRTFESEVPPPTPARLLNIPTAASSGALPSRKLLAPPPKPRASEAPVRKGCDVDLGTVSTPCGDSGVRRFMIPMPNASDRDAAKVRLEQDVPAAKIVGVTPAGGYLVVAVASDYRVSGSYDVKVVVESNGKTITGMANFVIERSKPQPFRITAIIGGQAEGTIPFMGERSQSSSFTAHFEPPVKEFRLTNTRGTMAAGAKGFPFRIIFSPKEAKPVVTLLIVIFDNAEEYTVEVVGMAAGFTGRSWKGRVKRLLSDIE